MSPHRLLVLLALFPLACGGTTDSDENADSGGSASSPTGGDGTSGGSGNHSPGGSGATIGSGGSGAVVSGGTGGVPTTGGASTGGLRATGGIGAGGAAGQPGTGGTGGVVDICELPAAPGTCDGYMPMFYFDAARGRCAEFVYGGCDGNGNRFATALDCMNVCGGDPPELCDLAPDRGSCTSDIPSYYFDASTGQCQLFSYGGCDGNSNRFTAETECLATCGDVNQGNCPLTMPDGACTTEGLACTYNYFDACLCVPYDAYYCDPVPACYEPAGTGGAAGFAPPPIGGGGGASDLPAMGGTANDPLPATGGGGVNIMPAPSTISCACSAGAWQCTYLF